MYSSSSSTTTAVIVAAAPNTLRCRSPNAGLEQEDHDRQHREQEARDGELGDLVQPQLREARLDHDDRGADHERLREQQPDREQHHDRGARCSPSPTGRRARSSRSVNSISCLTLDPQRRNASPGPECSATRPSSICPNSSVAAVALHRNPPRLGQHQHEERREHQQMTRAHDLHRRRAQRRTERVGQIGVRGEREHERHEDHGRLVERTEGPQPARARAGHRGCRCRSPRSTPRSWPTRG